MNTLFYHFLRSPTLIVDSWLLDDICGKYIVNDTFQLGTKQLVCTNEDFVCILGLSYRGTTIDPRGGSNKNPVSENRLHGDNFGGRERCRLLLHHSSFHRFRFDSTNQTIIRKHSDFFKDIINLWSFNWVGDVRMLTFSKLEACAQ